MKLDYWVRLLADRPRLEAFRAGIRAAVRPGDRVLEIGTGLGTFAFMAVQAGAREVVAIDSAPIVHLAETLGRRNGLGDRIRFVRGVYPEVAVDGRFDVIVFEDFAAQGLLDGNTVSVLRAARDRHLAEGGRLLPERIGLHLAPVRGDVARREVWGGLGPERLSELDLDSKLLARQLASTPVRRWLTPEALVGRPWDDEPKPVRTLAEKGGYVIEAGWSVAHAEEIGGLALWFSLHLPGGRIVDNRPSASGPDVGVWGQLLLPVDPPLSVRPEDHLVAVVERPGAPEAEPRWFRWSVEAHGERRTMHEFEGALLSPPSRES